MLGNIELKLATLDDLQAMELVGDRLFDNKIKTNQSIAFFNDSRHHLILAYDNAKIVGMASGFHYIHPDKDPILFINEVAVLDDYQNNEIARSMIKYLNKFAKQELECKEAWIATENSNISARKAFLAAGGAEHKEPIVLINFDLAGNKL